MELLDTQKYSECMLVAMINAAAFLGEPLVAPDSEEYERLVDLTGSRHGSVIWGHKAVEYLRLVKHDIDPISLENVRLKVMEGRPVQVGIQHPVVGFHAVLLTNGDGDNVRVWNMRRKEFPEDLLSWDRLREMMAATVPHCRTAMWYSLDPLKIKEAPKEPVTYRRPVSDG